MLEELATKAGLEYLPGDFSPPPSARRARPCSAAGLSSEPFTDLFNGADEQGRGHAVYEATLQRRAGKNT